MLHSLNRRKFLATSVASTIGIPAALRAGNRTDKLNIAVIGVNNRGADNLRGVAHENIVALCDVDEGLSAKTREQFPKAKFYTDYRKMFDQQSKAIDAVVVSTPDHTHAMAAALAMNLGKHVYCEKPLAHSVNETRVLRELAASKKLVTQMGTQIHAGDNYRRVVEIVQSGILGEIKQVHVWNSSRPVGGKRVGTKPTAKFDLDLWLGPCPDEFFQVAVNQSSWKFDWPHFHWRWWWEFGGGTLADLGCHYIDLPFWALGLTAPTRIVATGKKTYDGDDTTPDIMQVDYEFPAIANRPALQLSWYHGVSGPNLTGIEKYEGFGSAVMFVGSKGRLIADYGRYKVLDGLAKEFTPPPKTIKASVGHHKEWCEAIRNQGTTTCNFAYSELLTEAVLLGNVAYRTGEPITWNAEKGTTGNLKADALLGRENRKGWELPRG